MATELLMPKLGMTMEEGTIIKWFKQVGEQVIEGEIILEILTDKVNMEVESPATGQVLALLAGEDDVVEVNKAIAYIGQAGENVPTGVVAQVTEISPTVLVQAVASTATVQSAEGFDGKVKASPAARRVGREEGIDLHVVTPTGPGGRIIEKDVKNYKASPLATKIAQDKGVDLANILGTGIGGKIMRDDVQNAGLGKPGKKAQGNIKPLSGLRKIIADNMVGAWQAPHVTHNMEVDMSGMVALRKMISPSMEKRAGVKPSYNDLIIKVVGKALREYQQTINARLYPEGLEICDDVNVGMAVALPNGLIVPVVKNADRLSVEEIAKATKDLATRARAGKLSPDEMSGGTFTVTNLGMYGIDTFTPIVNSPEVCILGVGQLQDKVVVKDGEMVIQPRMSLSLSFDHRAVDGAQAAEFLRRLKQLLEDYLQLL